MPRTVPAMALQNPGNIVTSANWNSGPKAVGDFHLAPPMGRFRVSTTISTSSGSYFANPYNVTDVDTDSGHSNSVNNTRYTCQVAGWYLINGIVAWTSGGAVFDVWATIAVNGSTISGAIQVNPKWDFSGVSVESMVQLHVGDYVEIWGRQDSGGALSTANFGDLASSFNVLWVHS